MNETIGAVIFDADGTLVDSEVLGMDILYEMTLALGVSLTRDEAHRMFRGARMSDNVAWIAARLPHAIANFETDFTREYRAASARRFQEELLPLPGARELLSRLTIPFGVATNGPREKVELTLDITGLRPFVGDRIYCAYEINSFKPDPGLFLYAASQLGVPPARCAVVEDSLPGLQAGLAAGMKVFSLHGPDGLPVEVADRVRFIRHLAELDFLVTA